MADVTVDAASTAQGDERHSLWGPFWTSPSVGYIIQQESTDDIEVWKTADSGATWAEQDSANEPTNANNQCMAVWHDLETPGSSGTLLHIAWLQESDNEVHYISFDTSTDTYGTDRTIDSLTIASAFPQASDISVTVAKSGRIYVAARGDFNGDTENTDHSMLSSTDGFATAGTSETSPYSSDEEQVRLLPGSAADTDDICAVVYDVINTDLEFWKYDKSATTWGVTAIDATQGLTGSEARQWTSWFDCAVRHSDEHVLVAYWNDFDISTADFRCVDITQATPTITQKTNLVDNTDDSLLAAILINQQNDDVYVGYVGKDDGTETLAASDICYYKLSTDGMATWGTEAAYGELLDDLRAISHGSSVGDAGGRWMPAFWNDDLNDTLVNDGNDVEIAAAGGGGPVIPVFMANYRQRWN